MNGNRGGVSAAQMAEIRRYADRLLREADAYRRFPTPVGDLVEAADLRIEDDLSLDSRFLTRLYGQLPSPVKRALDKVLGVLDLQGRLIYLDRRSHSKRRVFLCLHEVGHGFLPWQRDVWMFLEDSRSELDWEIRDQFELEANLFAGELLFQGQTFIEEARAMELGVRSVLDLSKRYGSSFYAAARRYAAEHDAAVTLAVFDRSPGRRRLRLRREVQSRAFEERFGGEYWESTYGPRSLFGQTLPLEGRFGPPIPCRLRDRNGDLVACLAEAFDSGYQVFFLIRPQQ